MLSILANKTSVFRLIQNVTSEQEPKDLKAVKSHNRPADGNMSTIPCSYRHIKSEKLTANWKASKTKIFIVKNPKNATIRNKLVKLLYISYTAMHVKPTVTFLQSSYNKKISLNGSTLQPWRQDLLHISLYYQKLRIGNKFFFLIQSFLPGFHETTKNLRTLKCTRQTVWNKATTVTKLTVLLFRAVK